MMTKCFIVIGVIENPGPHLIKKTVIFDSQRVELHFTGSYLPPGEDLIVNVNTQASAADLGDWRVREDSFSVVIFCNVWS